MRIAMIAALMLAGLPAAAQNVGEGFVCTGPDGDVAVTVGRVDRLSEITGRAESPDLVILHVYMEGADDFVGHAAFEAAALAGCVADANTAFDDVAFGEGFDAYRAAAQSGVAVYYSQSPAEAFAAALQGE